MTRAPLTAERLTHSIIRAFFEVYNQLGFGFLEHIYVLALERELTSRGHQPMRELGVRVMYKGEHLSYQRMDLVVDATVIVEAKASVDLHRSAPRQLRNYLRATRLEVGLLLHFGPEPKFYRVYCPNEVKRSDGSALSE